MKYYHVYSDGKRIREIHGEEVTKLWGSNKKVVAVERSWLGFAKGRNYVWLARGQLEKLIQDAES